VTHYSSLEAANMSTLHHALLVLINQVILSLYSLIPLSYLDLLTKAALSEQISAAVTEILKSIEYHLQFTEPSAKSNRPAESSLASASGPHNFCLLLPLRVACRALAPSESRDDIAKKVWLEDVLNIITFRAGTWMSNDQIFGARRDDSSQVCTA
jgi:hypothetical protein